MWHVIFGVLVLGAILGSHCPSATAASCNWDDFQNQSYEQKKRAFVECTPEKRLELYLKHAESTEPPNFDFLDEVAKVGSALIPPLMARLESTNPVDEVDKPELLIVLRRMQELSVYKVRKDEALLARIDAAVSSMTIPELKAWAADVAASLRESKS